MLATWQTRVPALHISKSAAQHVGDPLPENRTLLVHFVLLVFLFGLFLERRACWRRRRRTGKLWCRRWSHPWLSQHALMTVLQCLQGHFEFRSRGQSRHSLIIDLVIIAEPFSFFQICPGGLRIFLCRLHIWIVDSAILQLPPQRMHLQCIGIGAQRLRLKTVVELLQLRQLRAVWRRRGAGSSSCSGKRSTDGGAASCPCIISAAINSALKRISPYVFIAVSVKCSRISRCGKLRRGERI